MKTLLLLLLGSSVCLGQSICSTAIKAAWEPRNIATKAGLVASYDPGNASTVVLNGSGVSALSNRVMAGTADLLQGTAANQPIISRADNCGNLLKQSEAFDTTWTRYNVNAFGGTDTGAVGAGSFANTARSTDPLGGNTADYIQVDATATISHSVRQVRGGLPTGSYWNCVFAKADTGTNVCLSGNNGPTSQSVVFNLASGAITKTNGAEITSASIQAFPNGWYLCSILQTLGANDSYAVCLASDNTTTFFSGDNHMGIFIWGASLISSSWTPVTGTDAAHGYIATTTLPIFPGLSGRKVMYFDGSAYRMQTAAFTLNQPTELYKLANPWTWTLNDVMCDGVNNETLRLTQSASTPKVRMDAGTLATEFTPPPLGTWRVTSAVFDGANSRMSTNSGAFTVSDAGLGNAGGFTLGSAATAGTTYWNGLVGRALLCNKTNSAAEADYLRWGLLKQASLK